jgi:hypothetical protein
LMMATPRGLHLGRVKFCVRLAAQAFECDSGRRLKNALENDCFGWNDSSHSTDYRPARGPDCGASLRSRSRRRRGRRSVARSADAVREDQPTRRSRANVPPAVSRTEARSETTETLGEPSRRWSLSRATSRWSASTHSPTLPWFVTADWSPQYRQTLFLGGAADFVTMPLDDVLAASTLGGDLSESPGRVTAEHTRRAVAHLSRYRAYDRVHVLIDRAIPGRVAR